MKADILIKTLSGTIDLSPQLIAALESSVHLEIYKPHQILHAAGNIENRLYFIEHGIARNYFYNQFGQEQTVRFWEPGDIMFSYEGYYKVSSYFYVEIMAESRFISITYEKLYELEKNFPETGLLIRRFLLVYQQVDFEKQQLISLPPEERYRYLREHNNSLFLKVSAKIIASYLHMSRETLSRYMSRR